MTSTAKTGENIYLDGVSIEGLSACVPKRVVDNVESCGELYKDNLESAIKLTGVRRRRFAQPGTTALDICVRAAEELAGLGGFDYSSFGGLVFVTMTPDYSMPNNASYAHKMLGLSSNAPAFDISMACSGYLYGLWVAGMAAKSTGKKILLLDGDTHSQFVSPYDRATAILFGDGGTATVIGPGEGPEHWLFDFVTVGDRESLLVPDSGFRNRFTSESTEYKTYSDGSRRRAIDLAMDGMSVFSSVTRHAPTSLKRIMEAEGRTSSDYDYLLLHQANLAMIELIAKSLAFPKDKFPTCIEEYGNIGSGSIALNICANLKDAVKEKRSRVLLSAFGAGFSVGSAAISLGPCVCTGVIEYE